MEEELFISHSPFSPEHRAKTVSELGSLVLPAFLKKSSAM